MKFYTILFLLLASVVYAKPPVIKPKEARQAPKKVIRVCCAFGNEVKVAYIPGVHKTDIVSFADLGIHGYLGGKKEGNGIVYTRHGGFIDVAHLRDYVDWTAYFYLLIHDLHKQGIRQYTLELEKEGGRREVLLNIPSSLEEINVYNWAGRMAYDVSLWHEIATWFRVSYIPLLVPEKFSSFSPEDIYSNLMGVHLGIQALKSDLPYEQAVTSILNQTLLQMGVVMGIQETALAMEKTAGDWWNDKKALPFNNLTLKRLFDRQCITPWLVPSFSIGQAKAICKPELQDSTLYSFTIDLNARFPRKDMAFVHKNTISHRDFPSMVEHIENEFLCSLEKAPWYRKRRTK